MYKKFFGIAMLIALLISVSALPVSAADNIETDGKYTVVTVESQGENRLEAIENGLVEALRLASGSFIDSKSELNNDELTERIISSVQSQNTKSLWLTIQKRMREFTTSN